MDSFKTHTTVNEDLKFIDLLPAKLRHALKRLAHAERWGIFVGLWPVTLMVLSYIIGKKAK